MSSSISPDSRVAGKSRIAVQRGLRHKSARPALFVLCLLPFLQWLYAVSLNLLGPDPADELAHATGEWAINFLLITLAITPAQQIFRLPVLGGFRRMLGLYSFFYASLHLLVFLALFLVWNFAEIVEEVLERPYITAGMLAWLALLPLAVTSTNGWRRRLGTAWKKLHRLVYLAASAAVLHVLWQVRSDLGEVFVYLLLLCALLGWHLYRYISK